jgi:hypothetical protein
MQKPDKPDISTDSKYKKWETLRTEMMKDPQKYDFDTTELQSLKPRYNNMVDGLDRDNKMYLEEENYLYQASIVTMVSLLFAAIFISSNR